MVNTKRIKTRDDLEGMGKFEPYIERNKWEYDAIHGALKPLDALSASLEVKWGRGRLNTFVSTETASKFDIAKAKLDASIAYNDPADVIKRANIMMRGWKALEAEALSNGHKPFPADVWMASVGDEGKNKAVSFAIVKDSADASMVKMQGINVYSLLEVARMVRLFQLRTDSGKIKKLFPDAVVTKISFDDDIPF